MEVVKGLGAQRRERVTIPTIGALRSPIMGHPFAAGLSLDHLGVAVRSIAAARGFYESLGMVVSDEETVEHEQVRTAMLPLGGEQD